ncbi:MAG: hypothetical protein ACPG6L_12025 [Nereida ignava]
MQLHTPTDQAISLAPQGIKASWRSGDAADCKSDAPLCIPTIFPRNSARTFPEQLWNAVTGGRFERASLFAKGVV